MIKSTYTKAMKKAKVKKAVKKVKKAVKKLKKY